MTFLVKNSRLKQTLALHERIFLSVFLYLLMCETRLQEIFLCGASYCDEDTQMDNNQQLQLSFCTDRVVIDRYYPSVYLHHNSLSRVKNTSFNTIKLC